MPPLCVSHMNCRNKSIDNMFDMHSLTVDSCQKQLPKTFLAEGAIKFLHYGDGISYQNFSLHKMWINFVTFIFNLHNYRHWVRTFPLSKCASINVNLDLSPQNFIMLDVWILQATQNFNSLFKHETVVNNWTIEKPCFTSIIPAGFFTKGCNLSTSFWTVSGSILIFSCHWSAYCSAMISSEKLAILTLSSCRLKKGIQGLEICSQTHQNTS